jgi:hypothetical protein
MSARAKVIAVLVAALVTLSHDAAASHRLHGIHGMVATYR